MQQQLPPAAAPQQLAAASASAAAAAVASANVQPGKLSAMDQLLQYKQQLETDLVRVEAQVGVPCGSLWPRRRAWGVPAELSSAWGGPVETMAAAHPQASHTTPPLRSLTWR
jgi:hypothetical protein